MPGCEHLILQQNHRHTCPDALFMSFCPGFLVVSSLELDLGLESRMRLTQDMGVGIGDS